MIAVRTLYACCVRAMNTLQQLLVRPRSVMDGIKSSWERRVDAVGTLWGRCLHAFTGKIDILGVFRGDPTARFQNDVRTLCRRRWKWQGLYIN